LAVDAQGAIIDINRCAEKLTGFTSEELLEKNVLQDLIIPQDREHIMEVIEKLMRGVGQTYEVRWRTKDGRILYFEGSSSARVTDEGKFLCTRCILRDITGRKRAEQALKESEKRFRDIADNALEWIWEVDSNGKYTYVSPVVERILGYKPEEILQKHFYDLFCPDDKEELKRAAFEVFAGKEGFRELINRNMHKNGKVVWLSTSGIPIIDERGECVGYRGADIDITERKEAEDKVRLLTTAVEQSSEGIAVVDLEGNILSLNKAFAGMHGYTTEELIGKGLSIFHTPEQIPAVNKANKQIKETGEFNGEIWHKRRDGTVFPALMHNSILRDEAGKPVGIIGTALDITERKKAEQKIQDYKAKLKAMASETLFIEETERRKIATELHDNVGQKLALAKFDLQSSMNSISDAAMLASINNLCAEIDNIVEDIHLLTFELSNPVLNELGLMAAIDKYLSEEIHEKHRIEVELSSDIGVDNLEGIVRRCLYRNTRELLVNVVKHANAHKVKVRIHHSADRIQIRVEDDGIGFDVKKIASLPADTGGFGLFSIREQLEYIGGNLQIESDAGKGTKVTITAPLKS